MVALSAKRKHLRLNSESFISESETLPTFKLAHLYFKFFLIEVYLIHNITFISRIRHSGSTNTHTIKYSLQLVQLPSVNTERCLNCPELDVFFPCILNFQYKFVLITVPKTY